MATDHKFTPEQLKHFGEVAKTAFRAVQGGELIFPSVGEAVAKATRSIVEAESREEIEAKDETIRKLKDALPPANRLETLADWFDLKYPKDKNPEVQTDLRGWASSIRTILEELQ